MARGTTLSALVTQLRAEIGQSTSSSVGQEFLPRLQEVLRRTQETLYDDYDWPFLFVRDADKAIVAGSRFYDFPTAVNPDRVQTVSVYWGNQWIPVGFGIDSKREYNMYNPTLNQRNDPVLKWDWYADGATLQFEVWPVPASNVTVRFTGVRPLGALVQDGDAATLDDRLIVLYSAAELRQGQRDADMKLKLAAARLARLKGNSVKSGPVKIGGAYEAQQHRRPVTIRIAGA